MVLWLATVWYHGTTIDPKPINKSILTFHYLILPSDILCWLGAGH